MAGHSSLLPRYQELREVSKKLCTRMLKDLSSDALLEAARRLGLNQGETLVLGSEDELSILMEHALHDDWREGKNAIQRYLEESPPPEGSIDRLVLESQAEAHYSLFEVKELESGVGATITDHLFGGTAFLVDIGLSTSARVGLVIAMRVFSPETFLMSTGAPLPVVGGSMRKIIDLLENNRKSLKADIHDLTRPQLSELVGRIIQILLHSGVSARTAYRGPREPTEGRVTSLRSARKAGRNDPCPCGSGVKYKRCCGGVRG
jgi:SEC-C motif-containing protein